MLPYEDVLDYSAFAIFFSEQDLLSNPKSNIFDILSKLPASEVERLQANGRKAIKHFTFSEGRPQPGDAFDMFVSRNNRIGTCLSCVLVVRSRAKVCRNEARKVSADIIRLCISPGSTARFSELQQPAPQEHAAPSELQDATVKLKESFALGCAPWRLDGVQWHNCKDVCRP